MSYDISLYVKSFLKRALASRLGDWTGADPIPDDAVRALIALAQAEGFVPDGPSNYRLASERASASLHVYPGEMTFAIEQGPHALESIALCKRLAERACETHDLGVWDPQADDEDDDTGAWLETLRSGKTADLRSEAAKMLAGREGGRVVAALVQAALADRSDDVRRFALESIGNLGVAAASATEAILPLLSDPDSVIVYWATYALGRLGPSAVSALPRLEVLTQSNVDGPKYGALDAIRRIRAAGNG